jgi:predicted patatin/cPLA2 family phospholipase
VKSQRPDGVTKDQAIVPDPNPRELLLSRGAERSTRNSRSDPYHLALVLEGGGMRGVVSVAMASAFEDRGLLAAFDSVHGSSAGACGGAYFAAGQAKYGMSVYYEDINNSQFIDLRRPLWRQPIMNKDFLIDCVMRQKKRLCVDRILSNRGFINIVATDAMTGKEAVFRDFRDEDHFFLVLKATVCLPIIAGKFVNVDGAFLLDGGIVQQIAIRSAIDIGATHIIILMTRQRGDIVRRKRSSQLDWENLGLRFFYGRNLENAYRHRNGDINEIVEACRRGKTREGASLAAIARRPDSVYLDRLTTNGEALRQACSDARHAAFEFLDVEGDQTKLWQNGGSLS